MSWPLCEEIGQRGCERKYRPSVTGRTRSVRAAMRNHLPCVLLSMCIGFIGCGPESRPGEPGNPGDVDAGTSTPRPDADWSNVGRFNGRVWAPGLSPAIVPSTDAIPVFGASVYFSAERPPPIPDRVYCQACQPAPPGSDLSAHDGSFSVNAPAGAYWLVIEKGQFRSEQLITVVAGTETELPPAQTTLPSTYDPENGQWMPKVAVVLGTNDDIQDILAKMSIGQLGSDQQFVSTGGEFDLYRYSGGGADTAGTFPELVGDLERLRDYHVILFPCSLSMGQHSALLMDQAGALRNLRQYVKDGGRMYVTDWSGEVMDRPFPPQIAIANAFGEQYDTTGTYDPVTLTGSISAAGNANGDPYDTRDGEAVDDDLAAWLGLQTGPNPPLGLPTAYDPSSLTLTDSWNQIAQTTAVPKGEDADGNVLMDQPKTWVIGSNGFGSKKPMTVTFEPTGCGRVMYSVYQTSNDAHPGLFPQERILLYLLLEIGVCVNDVPIE